MGLAHFIVANLGYFLALGYPACGVLLFVLCPGLVILTILFSYIRFSCNPVLETIFNV